MLLRSMRSLRGFGVLLCALFLLVLASGGLGCSSTPPSRRLLLEVIISPRSNQNSPVPVAFVAVSNPKLLEKVLEMNAKQWFEQREQLHRDFPGGDSFTEWEWEYVPGQSPPPVVIEVDGNATGAMIFANYRTPGDHRFRVGPIRRMRINLEDEDFSVSPLEEPGDR
jgi:type VI secretion system protein